MKKMREGIYCGVVCAVLSMMVPAVSANTDNLILNGGFEQDFSFWNYAGAAIDTTVFSEGTRSGKLDCSNQEMYDWRSNLYPAAPEKRYTLVFSYMTSADSTLAGPDVRLRFYQGVAQTGESLLHLNLTHGAWVTVELSYTCHAGQDGYDLFFTTNRYASDVFKGVVWFDNIGVYSSVAGDLSEDGVIDFDDLQLFCLQWLNQGADYAADFNTDDIVNNGDFKRLSENWQSITAQDSFNYSSSMADWTIVDEGNKSAPSAWQILNGEFYEPSNIYGPNTADIVDNRHGTFAYWNDPDALAWADYEFSVSLRTSDNDGTGVIFRYKDPNNYYKFDMDCERVFRKLFKMVNGVETLLASDLTQGYPRSTQMNLTVRAIGSQINVLLDGVNVFGGTITDSDLQTGTVALYDWGCTGMYFDRFSARVTRLQTAALNDVYDAFAGQTLNAASVLSNDVPQTDATAELVTAPAHGQITFRPDGTFDYTPNADFGGNERFTYRASCGGSSAIATVTVKVDTPNSFTLVILPDTQVYTLSYPTIFDCQTTWIATHKDELKLAFVLQEGDLTDSRTTVPQEWQYASDSLAILDAANVPYAIVHGNHDLPSTAPRDLSVFNTYFPVSRYSSTPTFGGVYEPNHMENSWHTFTAGGIDWLVFAFEFGPRDAVLAWANGIIAAHPNHKIIVVTHGYMFNDDTRQGDGDPWNPNTYVYCGSYDGTCNDGEEMWENFVKLHANMTFVFSGHVLGDGTGRRVDAGINGNPVVQILANFQMYPNGGNGYLRIVKCFPESGNVTVESYSPYLDQYLTAEDQQFEYTGLDF